MAVIMNRLNKSLIIFCFIYISCSLNEKEILVRNLSQFNQAVSNVIPGSIITMANGEWENVELRLKGIVTKGNPILLRSETPFPRLFQHIYIIIHTGIHNIPYTYLVFICSFVSHRINYRQLISTRFI